MLATMMPWCNLALDINLNEATIITYHRVWAYCLVLVHDAADYKAPGSLPGEHETLIPFITTCQHIFFRPQACGRGESDCHKVRKPLGGSRGVGESVEKTTRLKPGVLLFH